MQVIYCMFLLGNFDSFSADIDKVMDGLPDGSTDKSDDVQMARSFPGIVLLGIFIQEYSLAFSPQI